MPVSEGLRRLSEDPAFWAALFPAGHPPRAESSRAGPTPGGANPPGGRAAPAGELRVSFPVAGGYGLVLDLDPGTGVQHLGLRGPSGSEPVQLGWAAPGQPHPAALRWWELELCARVIALDDPTLPHPGLVVALLSPFAPATPDDDTSAVATIRAAAYRSMRRAPARHNTGTGPEQEPLPLFADDVWWPLPAEPSTQVLDEAVIAAYAAPPPILVKVRDNPRFPSDVLADLMRHAARRLARLPDEPVYSGVQPLARQITATADLTAVPRLVSALTEAGCDHPTVLDALSEPLVPAEACWMVETLAGADPGTLLRHHL